ncbi:hypothetical protein COL22_07130 [Bacillus thuringiensis]|nr:hypothetical protein COL22_07130 [Bacillus thuringiensis]
MELAVRRVQLLVQVEQPKSSFSVCSAWRHTKTRRKKFCKDKAERKRWRFLSRFLLKNTTCSLRNF